MNAVLHDSSPDAATPSFSSFPIASSIGRPDCGQALVENAMTRLDEIEHNF
jgi:2-methylisocitrate lyase-like PEP mutase family enzyme